MKVCIIAGSLPPEVCGVGDFTAALAEGLGARGVEVQLLHRTSWGLSAIPYVMNAVRRARPDIVHLEYPTHGFRTSLVPHILHVLLSGWIRVTTLHDYIAQNKIKRLAMSAFALGGRVILVGPEDLRVFRQVHPWMRGRTTMIPIGSNIPGGKWQPEGPFTVIHFGMLRPDKGIEEFIALARLARDAGLPYRMRFVGAVLPHGRNYADSIFHAAADLPIEWHLNESPARVSELLRTAHVVYLPPPSGVHERRGTLLAAALNGTPIVARVGPQTPDTLRPYVLAADNPHAALAIIADLQDPDRLAEQSLQSYRMSEMFSWDFIISQYIKYFSEVATPAAKRMVATGSRTAQ